MEDRRGHAAAVTLLGRALVTAALALGVAQQRESVDVYQVVLEAKPAPK